MRKNPVLLLSLIILLPLSGCAALKQRPEDTVIRIKGKKEILVARDVGRGAEVYGPTWCGSDGLLYHGEAIGAVLIDIETKKRIQISRDPDDTPGNCTPDGNWVLYYDHSSLRVDPAYEYEEGAFFGWMGNVLDLYRYEIATGRKEKVAIVRGDAGHNMLSPDGEKVFLGARHSFASEVAAVEWKVLWLTDKWNEWSKWSIGKPVWFPDSSGVVLHRDYPNSICIEFFGREGWAKCFELGSEYEKIIPYIFVDRNGRIYFSVNDDNFPQVGSRYFLYRCDIKDRALSCERILDLGYYIEPNFLHNGGMVFKDQGNGCIRRLPLGQYDSGCILDSRSGEVVYNYISPAWISPDGRRLAFERGNRMTRPDSDFSYLQRDLFVIELEDD